MAVSQKTKNPPKDFAMSLELAVDAAFNGPDAPNLMIQGHLFDVARMSISQVGARTIADGRISHRSGRPLDDSVVYRLEFAEHRLVSSRRRIEYSDWPAVLTRIAPPWVGTVDHFLALVAQRFAAGDHGSRFEEKEKEEEEKAGCRGASIPIGFVSSRAAPKAQPPPSGSDAIPASSSTSSL